MFVDKMLTAWGLESICEDARLITSEPSANAVLHAPTDFRVTLRSDGLGHLRIEVRDGKYVAVSEKVAALYDQPKSPTRRREMKFSVRSYGKASLPASGWS